MIENLALHGVVASDLSPALMTTHTVANPEYDPAEAQRQEQLRQEQEDDLLAAQSDDISETTLVEPSEPIHPGTPKMPTTPGTADPSNPGFQTTTRVLEETTASQIPGVSTTLSSADENVTLDIRWTVLCDLFLILIADSVYDARSRVLLEQVALHLGLGWVDVVKFEQRVTEALEIQEGVERMEQQAIIEGRVKSSRKRRYMMMGLATLGLSSLRSNSRCAPLMWPPQVVVLLLDCLLAFLRLLLVRALGLLLRRWASVARRVSSEVRQVLP
jgi:hypothetical protein